LLLTRPLSSSRSGCKHGGTTQLCVETVNLVLKTDDIIAEVNVFFAKIGDDAVTEFVFVGFLFEGFDVAVFSLTERALSCAILSCTLTLRKDTTARGGGGGCSSVVFGVGVVGSLSEIGIVGLGRGGILVEGREW